MRTAWLWALLACTACSDRRSFDERYEQTAEQLEDKARQLDEQVAKGTPSDSSGNVQAVDGDAETRR